MKKSSKNILSWLLCVAIIVWLQPIASFAAENTDEALQNSVSVLSEELQAKENAANEKYNTLLRYWAFDPQYVSDMNADFPAFYGGAYINEGKELVIQVTELKDDITAYFASMIDLEDVVFEEVKYSFLELKAEYDAIREQLNPYSRDATVACISGIGLSFRNNSINLYVVAPEESSASTYSDQDVKSRVSSFENIRVITTSGMDIPCTGVRPGTGMTSGSIWRGSVGFWAYDQNNNIGIVTAPHWMIIKGDIFKIGSDTFGTAASPYYSGNTDAVFVKRTNDDFTPSRYVSGFNLKSNAYIYLAEGSTTYSKGNVSGYQTGTVTDVNYTTSYDIYDCVLCDVPSQGGDSGGIVAGGGDAVTRYTAGIITGSQEGTDNMIYIKAANIINNLGVSIY